MAGDEGIDFLREVPDAVSCGHTEVAGLSIVSLHLRIVGNRSLLRARKAQEGDCNQDNEKNRRAAQNADIQRFTSPISFKSLIFRDLDVYALYFISVFRFIGAKAAVKREP